MRLTELEKKLLRLALDKAAVGGEVDTSAVKLINAWRARGVSVDEVEAVAAIPRRLEPEGPDYGTVAMPFGKWRGYNLREIPPDYLLWLRRRLKADRKQRFGTGLLDAITAYLRQAA